jgi:pyruvate dehydrogenase E1 component alpha subunit
MAARDVKPARNASNKLKKSTSAAAMTLDELLAAYEKMLLIRRFEEKAGQLYGMGLIGGFCHLYIGQEAVVTGMQFAIQPGDQVITSYRDHGHMLACDMDPTGVMAELTGRSGGYSHGKGGSMHMFSKEKGFYGGHGIVGAQVSLGTGLAFANHYRGNDRVCLTYFGEGASNQGQVFESFNLAAQDVVNGYPNVSLLWHVILDNCCRIEWIWIITQCELEPNRPGRVHSDSESLTLGCLGR